MRSEHDEQCALIHWFRLQHRDYADHLFAVPNGGARHPAVASKLKAEGVVAGVSDLFLMVARPGCSGLWIEMKARDGRLSEHQKRFQERAQAQGFKAITCYGFEQARAAITECLG